MPTNIRPGMPAPPRSSLPDGQFECQGPTTLATTDNIENAKSLRAVSFRRWSYSRPAPALGTPHVQRSTTR